MSNGRLPLLQVQDPEAAARQALDAARRHLAAAEGNHIAPGGDAAEVDAAFDTFDPPIRSAVWRFVPWHEVAWHGAPQHGMAAAPAVNCSCSHATLLRRATVAPYCCCAAVVRCVAQCCLPASQPSASAPSPRRRHALADIVLTKLTQLGGQHKLGAAGLPAVGAGMAAEL